MDTVFKSWKSGDLPDPITNETNSRIPRHPLTRSDIKPRLSRPSHNLSGNGQAATSRDTGVTNRDLDASREATRGYGPGELGEAT